MTRYRIFPLTAPDEEVLVWDVTAPEAPPLHIIRELNKAGYGVTVLGVEEET